MMEARQKLIEERAKAKLAESGEDGAQAATNEDQDAEKDGDDKEETSTTAPPVVADDSDDDDDDLDIEASIQKELAALKSGRGGSQTKVKVQDKGKGKAKERPRFQNISTDTECREFTFLRYVSQPSQI
jgi:tRNA acetyltransferase TAN1